MSNVASSVLLCGVKILTTPMKSIKYSPVAQLVEQGIENPRVVGSSPAGRAMVSDQSPRKPR